MNDVARAKPLQKVAPAPAPSVRSSRRPFAILAIVVLLGLSGLGVYMLVTAGQVSTDDAQVDADVVPLAPRIGGAVRKLLVAENQRVKAGQLLLQLDDADEKARVDQAEADLAVAQAQVEAAEAQEQVVTASATGGLHSAKAQVSSSQVDVQSAESRIKVARAELEHAQANARKSGLDLARIQQLRAGNAIAQDQLDSAQAADDSARAALSQAEAALAAAEDAKRGAVSRVAEAQGKLAASTPIEAQISAAHAQAALARARVQSMQAALRLAKLQLSYTQASAPQDGMVSNLSVHEGQLVGAKQPFAELVPDTSYVVANFKETQIGAMHPGDRADVVLDAYPGHHFEGAVESLAGGTGARFSLMPPDNASGNFVKVVQRVPVRIAWKTPPGVPLRAGLSADVTVFVGKAPAK